MTSMRNALPMATLLCIVGAATSIAEEVESLLIRVLPSGHVAVEPVRDDHEHRQTDGILVAREGRSEHWIRLQGASGSRQNLEQVAAVRLAGETRGGAGANEQAIALAIGSIEQLASGEVVRGAKPGGFLTPLDQATLANPQITIRRLPADGKVSYPTDECILYRGRDELVRFPFPEGKSVLKWADISNLPKSLAQGLAPGKYLLRIVQAKDDGRFEIDSGETFRRVTDISTRLQKLVPESLHLRLQIGAEILLNHRDEAGNPAPYLVDAFDLLDHDDLPAYLRRVKSSLVEHLKGAEPVEMSSPESTGVEAIDWARDQIARGQWNEALETLDGIANTQSGADPRDQALVSLYRGVILAESGAATGAAAEFQFASALEATAKGKAADRFRVHNNYANFLLRRAQDGLYNRSFRAASGSTGLMFAALRDWQRALEHYEQAQSLAPEVSPAAASGVAVNLARHYALLADAIYFLNASLAEKDRFLTGEHAAAAQAERLASQVLVDGAVADSLTQAAAAENLAHLFHRRGDEQKSREFANRALQSYLAAGSVLGAEGIYRLIGLTHVHEMEQSSPPGSVQRHEALRYLQVSHELSQHLREQFPADVIGLSRAGFLSRRAYVNELVVELLLEEAEFEAALLFLEGGKARALQDMLLLNGIGTGQPTVQKEPAEILDKWPEETLALEYFIGPNSAWVFCVTGAEQVTAVRLADQDGAPLKSSALVADVRGFLNRMEGAAAKMLRAASPDKPFDDRWQEDLHRFYHQLLPAEIRARIADRQNIVIVPQHILHYFPFAALVSERDKSQRGPYQSAMPTFWIESGVNLVQAPSLGAWRTLRLRSDQAASGVQAVGIATFSAAKPLPGVKDDLKNLRASFGDQVGEVVTGSKITEATLYDVMNRPGLTFIGTHGSNVADQPLASYLLCHSDGQSDGRLMAGEMYGAKLLANVVVLSACYSGLADRSPLPGDDLFGIERALLHAGVRTVVDGIWDVYDETGSLVMQRFFVHFSQGKPTPVAVAEAQRDFLKQRRAEGPNDPWIHPYFWSVYKVSGSDLTSLRAASP